MGERRKERTYSIILKGTIQVTVSLQLGRTYSLHYHAITPSVRNLYFNRWLLEYFKSKLHLYLNSFFFSGFNLYGQCEHEGRTFEILDARGLNYLSKS